MLNFELRNHPAQARHPVTKAPLFDADNKPVPLFPKMRALYLDGVLIAYCQALPGYPVTFTHFVDAHVSEAASDFVEAEIGRVASINMPPEIDDEFESEGDDE